jgi:hypothetical protein
VKARVNANSVERLETQEIGAALFFTFREANDIMDAALAWAQIRVDASTGR